MKRTCCFDNFIGGGINKARKMMFEVFASLHMSFIRTLN